VRKILSVTVVKLLCNFTTVTDLYLFLVIWNILLINFIGEINSCHIDNLRKLKLIINIVVLCAYKFGESVYLKIIILFLISLDIN